MEAFPKCEACDNDTNEAGKSYFYSFLPSCLPFHPSVLPFYPSSPSLRFIFHVSSCRAGKPLYDMYEREYRTKLHIYEDVNDDDDDGGGGKRSAFRRSAKARRLKSTLLDMRPISDSDRRY